MGKIGINIKSGSLSHESIAVGIDLGTTNSLIAWMNPSTQVVEVIPINEGSSLFPSLVYLNPDGSIQSGPDALRILSVDPSRVIYSIKSHIGISSNEFAKIRTHYPYLSNAIYGPDGVELISPKGNRFTPIDISSFILSAMINHAESFKGKKIQRAVITVPAYFDESQRAATKMAGEKAGLEVLRIINEPTAACLAYGYGDSVARPRILVVYDLGGGTFDVSVVRVESGVFEVLSTHGDTRLGGDDIDRSIVQHWLRKNNSSSGEFQSVQLRTLAKQAKELLSVSDHFESAVADMLFQLDREELEALSAPWVDRTIQSCKQALADANLSVSDIEDVLMVGGSTRMPYVKKRVAEYFSRDVNDQLNPDEVVAIGAALQAAQLNGAELGHLLLDVTPLSLGIETAGGLMDVLIPRNSKIPTRVSRQYTTQKDGQTSIRISVYQGERDLIEFNRLLSVFQVSDIPAMPAGLPKLTVTFQMDANGLLRVQAKEERSGVIQEVIVNPADKLSKDQIENRLQDAMSHSAQDKEARARITLTEEASSILTSLQKLLRLNEEWIPLEQATELRAACQSLQNAIDQSDLKRIKKEMSLIEEMAKPITEEVMNRAVGDRLRDTHI